LVAFGLAAIAFGMLGYSVSHAQVVEKTPDEELAPELKGANPVNWSGSGTHPGKAGYEKACQRCHSLGTNVVVGPGLSGLFGRIQDSHKGEDPYLVVADFVERTVMGAEEKNYDKDPYFRKVQETIGGAGVQMATRGDMNLIKDGATRADLLEVIDYIFRFRQSDFVSRYSIMWGKETSAPTTRQRFFPALSGLDQTSTPSSLHTFTMGSFLPSLNSS
jgi:cytochrome c2